MTALKALRLAEVARSPSPEGEFTSEDENKLAEAAAKNEALGESLVLGLAAKNGHLDLEHRPDTLLAAMESTKPGNMFSR